MLSKEALSQMTPEQIRALRRKAQAIPALPRDGRDLPASFSQQRLWFLAQMSAAADAYHISLATTLRGDLDRTALQWALDRLVARHESLRTRFEAVDGVPYQRIDPPSAFVLHDHDLRGAADADARLQALQALEANASFDLVHGPPIRGRLVRLADAHHVLLVTMHHIVSDGWSMGVFARELEALYAARLRGDDDPLPALPVQYADYAVWQRERMSGERLEREGAYWREALRGAPALLELPADHPRPAEQDYRGDWLQVRLDAELTAQLKALSLQHGVTLYMTLMAAWAAVLSRLSGQTDVVVGTPVANRNRSEVEALIGFFVNTLAVRIAVDDATTVATLLAQVKATVLSAQEHQDLPFEQVVEQVNPARSLAYAPLFQTVFAWQNNASGDLRLSGLEAAPLTQPHAVSKFDLTLGLGENGEGAIAGVIEYSTRLFEADTIRRYAGCLQTLLRGMVEDASRPVNRLPLLDAETCRRVTDAWNATDADYGPWEPVHARVERVAAQSPRALAVTCGDVELDYGDLNVGANRLAHWLRAQGVGTGVLVAICMQRSEFAIEAVLGVMKSGGAYVPVDPGYPRDRVADMLDDARPLLVLSDRASREAVSSALSSRDGATAPRVIEVDGDRGQWSSAADTDPTLEETGLTAEHPAYVIYTSGSTGKPKGVVANHRGPFNLMCSLREPFALSSRTRVLQFASFSFDAFVLEWAMAFCDGGSLHLGAPGEVLLGDALESLVARRQVTHCFLTPTLLSSLPASVTLASIEVMACGGEAVPPAVHQRWHRGRRLFNAYGPTETTALSIIHLLGPECLGADNMPIGRPLGNERVYLLDPHLQPVPVGVQGELYIGGAGVAQGYLRRPELTAERFIDSPFVAGDRLYRTGDVGRWRADGLIEYRGRNDFQVKIRGYRIELGEIEARLAEAPGVKEAVVVANAGADGSPRLVAYYEGRGDVATTVESLRHTLSKQLPDYMVPSVFVEMTAWPMNSNGKLDRKALPAPDADMLAARGEYVAPQSPIEEILAGIWSELLGVERIGIHDNFFELGGHSLMAMRMLAAVRETFGFSVQLKTFFELPTIAHMGRSLLPDEDADDAAGQTACEAHLLH